MLQAELDDGTGQLTLRFLNFWPNQVSQLTPGRGVRAHGDVRGGLFGLEMVHPRWRVVRAGDALPQRLTPVYPTVAGIGQAELRRAVLERGKLDVHLYFSGAGGFTADSARADTVPSGSATTIVPTSGGDSREMRNGISVMTPNMTTGTATAPKMKPFVSAVWRNSRHATSATLPR
jgi:hypothetical protein